MKDFFQALQDAFPVLRHHPVLIARLTLAAIVVAGLYVAKGPRRRVCKRLSYKLYKRIAHSYRWLYLYQNSDFTNEWKYYTSETTGEGSTGDDVIWTLVEWPSLKPKDSFRVPGAVGWLNGVHESQAKLLARWQIVHDPDKLSIGPVPARGLRSKLRRVTAKLLHTLGSSF